jgi:hypothetical protein
VVNMAAAANGPCEPVVLLVVAVDNIGKDANVPPALLPPVPVAALQVPKV